jgi:hypothetical protein
MLPLLILQYTAHLLADFTFQPQRWCDVKDSTTISKTHFYHAIVVFICSLILSLSFSFWWAALLIALFHFGLDVAKSALNRKGKWKKYLFFIDQALHIAFITLIMLLCDYEVIGEYYSSLSLYHIALSNKFVFALFAVVACGKPSNIFIKKFMEANSIFPVKEEDSSALINAGRVIGSLERLLSFVLIVFNQFAAVGFIIAAKSILRFRDTATAKTEYLLIGSLLSFGIAILLGIAYLSI